MLLNLHAHDTRTRLSIHLWFFTAAAEAGIALTTLTQATGVGSADAGGSLLLFLLDVHASV